jgi:TRAP-type transport system small permease protein
MLAEEKVSLSTTPVMRLSRLPVAAGRVLLGVLLLAMVALNVANAVGRYAIGAVFIGADELLMFSLVWLVMVGTILVTAEQSHIALDFIVNRSGPRAALLLRLLHHVVVAGACGYAATQSFAFVGRVTAFGQTSMAMGIPMAIPHSALVVGLGGTALVAAALALQTLLALPDAFRRRQVSAT